jgi:hypothetical protein
VNAKDAIGYIVNLHKAFLPLITHRYYNICSYFIDFTLETNFLYYISKHSLDNCVGKYKSQFILLYNSNVDQHKYTDAKSNTRFVVEFLFVFLVCPRR